MENKFKTLDPESEHKDVALSLLSSSTFRLSDFIAIASEVFRDNCLNVLNEVLRSRGRVQIPLSKHQHNWFGDGIGCEILSPGAKGWQQGKVKIKISLEFCPDEPEVEETLKSKELEKSQPESPLADIRQMVTGNHQQGNS